MLRTVFVATLLSLTPVAAFANQCPSMMSAIDAALPNAQLSEADRVKVAELRAKGEQEHQAGDHAASEASLAEAMRLLGI